MGKILLVTDKRLNPDECSYGLPWKYDAVCYNFKAPTDMILAEDITSINPNEVEGIVIGCDLDNYLAISKMVNIKQLYIYKGNNINDLDFIENLYNLNHLYIEDSHIQDLDSLVTLMKKQKEIYTKLSPREKILFGLSAICVNSTENLDGAVLRDTGWYTSEIIVNKKWI